MVVSQPNGADGECPQDRMEHIASILREHDDYRDAGLELRHEVQMDGDNREQYTHHNRTGVSSSAASRTGVQRAR